ncbi:DUF5684 domain-containing protein [Clostridium cadaveris]
MISSFLLLNRNSFFPQFAEFSVYSVWFTLICLISILPMWKIFEKAGQDGWKSIIPIYNTIILLKICGLSPFLVILSFIPYVTFILSIILWYNLSKAFGKGIGFTLGLIFLDVIFLFILAFGSNEYNNPNVYDV